MKTIALTAAALDALGDLPKKERARINAKLARYAETGAGDVRPMIGQPGLRLRIGNYRAVFVENTEEIRVFAIGHRRDVYD